MMEVYSISGTSFGIDFKNPDKKFELFKADDGDCRARITVGSINDIGSRSFGVEYVSKEFAHFLRSESSPSCVLFSNSDWTQSDICDGNSDELMIAAVYSVLCKEKTLFIHSATVDFDGEGIVFVGPSGIGKTTQAELWQKYAGADVINGDKIFVRKEKNGFEVYASPWKGSSPYCLNRNVPLKAVVVLRQSKENSIRRLNAQELYEYLVPHVFLPFWDENCMNYALETLDEFLTDTQVYLLECRPDEEAVNITKKVLSGE